MVSTTTKEERPTTPPGRPIANSFTFGARGGKPGVFRVRVSNGVEERVVDLKGFRSTGAAGGFFGLDPDDTPLLIRIRNG